MQATARVRYLRVTPQKARRVVNMIRGRRVGEALAILKYAPQGASDPIYKLLASAKANFEQQAEVGQIDDSRLIVHRAYVDEAGSLRRMRPRAKGAASRILKRRSHITLVVAEESGE